MKNKSLLGLTTGMLLFGMVAHTNAQTYCIPELDCSDGDLITNVTFGTINNPTTCSMNGYGDYTTLPSPNIATLLSYPISVTVGAGFVNESVSVWIDYNQNGTFETNEFTYIGTGSGSVVSGMINVPATATLGTTTMRVRVAAVGSTSATADMSCDEDQGYGETEDYSVNIVVPTPCAGTPSAGLASASQTAVCAGISINLTSNVVAEGGFSYQWQSSSDGGITWGNLGVAQTSINYTVSGGITQNTDYRIIVTCTNSSESDTSNAVSVTLNPVNTCYCEPESDCTDSDVITNVTFAGINNNSTCSASGYNDFTSSAAGAITAGTNYPISVTIPPHTGAQHVAAWIDYNQNGIFEASEFTLIGSSPAAGSVVTSNIAIPITALGGQTRMRVRARFNTALTGADACLVYTYGETEDYLVNITPPTPCAGTPAAGIASSSVSSVCVGASINLTSDVTPQGGFSYQWQSSIDAGTTWTNLGTAQSNATYATTQTQATDYRLIVTCTNSSESDTSNTISVAQNAPTTCYCIPSIPFQCGDGDVITNVTFGSINNNSACGSTTTGYSDYSTSVAPATVLAGATIPISVSVGPSGDGWLYESVGVWIDFNQNGLLDSLENEYTPVGTGLNQAVTGNIVIPANATLGTTRMRVVVTAAVTPLSSAVCGPIIANNPYGEMEDYSITITDVAPIIDSVAVTTQGGAPATITTQGGTLPLVATVYPSSQPQTVTWSIIPGTGSATISSTGVVTATTNGTVWGKAVSTVDATKSDSILITITGQTVGVEDISNNIDFTLFPNPTSESITLKASADHAELQIQMLDVTGRILSNRMVQANELNGGILVDLSTFAPGTYFVTLTGQNVRITKTVIRR
jgi:hypothetical protein